MRFEGLDLNLLVALDALFRERSLTAAARSIHLSQPAMSAAVTRLRLYFGDDLFVMRGRELALTPLSISLQEPVQDILRRVKLTLRPQATFEPATASRSFRIIMSDYISIVFFERIVRKLEILAPKVTFEMLPFDDDPDRLLREGSVDFLIFPDVYLGNEHPKVPLFEEELVCVACATNEQANEDMSFAEYMAFGHVAARFGRSRKPSIEEWLLLKYGVTRRVEVATQSFAVLPSMVVGTRRVATMHRRLAEHYARSMPLKILPLPLPLPNFSEGLQWPTLADRDPASVWMRNVIKEEAEVESIIASEPQKPLAQSSAMCKEK